MSPQYRVPTELRTPTILQNICSCKVLFLNLWNSWRFFYGSDVHLLLIPFSKESMTIKNVSNFDLFDTCAPLAVDYRATWHTFWLQPSKCFPKKILIFSPKKSTLKKILTFFLRRCLSYTLGNGTFLYFLEKRFFLIFWEIELSYNFPKKFFLYFRKWNFCALAPIFPNKIFLYFSL